MADIVLNLESLQKPANATHLAQALKQVSGVTAVHIEPITLQATVAYDPQKPTRLLW